MEKVEKAFDERMKPYDNKFSKVKLTSEIASELFKDRSLDFVYIDGCHQYESALQDIKFWLPKVRFGGAIGGHDFSIDDVQKAVKEMLGTHYETFKDGSWLYKIK